MEDHSSSLQDILDGLDDSFGQKGDSFLAEEEDRDTFPVTSHSYRLQIAHLEGRLRDYAERLQAKDREIALAKTLQQPLALPSNSEGCRDSRLAHMEEENKQLRGLSSLRNEIDRLRRELIRAQRFKSALEGKYNEAALRLATLEKAEDADLQGEEGERMKEMLMKVELFKHANSDLHAQVASLSQALQTAQSEREHLRSLVIPDLQRSIAILRGEIQRLEIEIAELRGSPLRSMAKESHISIMDLEGRVGTSQTPALELMTDRIETCYSPTSDNQLSPKRRSPCFFRKSLPGQQQVKAEPRKPLFQPHYRKPAKVILSRPAHLTKKPLRHARPKPGKDRFAELFPEEDEFE